MNQTVVLVARKELSQAARESIGRQLREWGAEGRPPVVLDGGMQMSILGGLAFRVRLSQGPLDGLTFTISVPSLADLPSSFDYLDGSYGPWVADDGVWMQTTSGDPCYIWTPVPA